MPAEVTETVTVTVSRYVPLGSCSSLTWNRIEFDRQFQRNLGSRSINVVRKYFYTYLKLECLVPTSTGYVAHIQRRLYGPKYAPGVER